MSDLRINIHGRNDHNTINEKKYPKFEDTLMCLKSEGGSLASKNVRIVFEPSAVKPLFSSIAWGAKYKYGDVEQAGILIGNYYRDCSTSDEVLWGDVVTVIPADSALVNASFETIDITADSWKKMYEDAAMYRTENLQIIGWYHTHLANLSTRFSGLDRTTQRKAFTYKYSFGVVFNPNQGKWSAFYGPESRECLGELLFDEELSVKYGKPQITIKQVNGDSELQEDGLVVHFDEDGDPIENHSAKQRVYDTAEADILSLRQLVGQFYNGCVQLIRKGEKRYKNESPVRNRIFRRSSESCNNVHNTQSFPFASEQQINANDPKIEIKNSSQPIPVVKSQVYSMSTNNEFILHPKYKCIVKEDIIQKIIKYKQSGLIDFTKGYLWGYIWQSSIGLNLSLASSEQESNTKIVFLQPNISIEQKKIVVNGMKEIGNANVVCVAFADNANSRAIDISVFYYDREA